MLTRLVLEALRGTKKHTALTWLDLKDKYGPVVTFWIGSSPMVFLFDLELTKEAFKKGEFSGRPKLSSCKIPFKMINFR